MGRNCQVKKCEGKEFQDGTTFAKSKNAKGSGMVTNSMWLALWAIGKWG